MNNISLEQVRLPEGQTSYITKPFTGELYGNNQVIHGCGLECLMKLAERYMN